MSLACVSITVPASSLQGIREALSADWSYWLERECQIKDQIFALTTWTEETGHRPVGDPAVHTRLRSELQYAYDRQRLIERGVASVDAADPALEVAA